jgi:hypothetical protein
MEAPGLADPFLNPDRRFVFREHFELLESGG